MYLFDFVELQYNVQSLFCVLLVAAKQPLIKNEWIDMVYEAYNVERITFS